MNKINPPELYLVRSKCDMIPPGELQELKAADLKYIRGLSVNREILYISSIKEQSFEDNARFRRLLLGQ